MNAWLSFGIGLFAGGTLSWFFAKKVYDKGEEYIMEAAGYFKRGEDWVKSEAAKIRKVF